MQNKFNRSNCLSHMISSAMWIRKSLLKQNNYGKVLWIYFNYLSRWSFIFLLGWNKYCVLPTAIVCSFMRKLLHQPNQYSTYCSDSMVLFCWSLHEQWNVLNDQGLWRYQRNNLNASALCSANFNNALSFCWLT